MQTPLRKIRLEKQLTISEVANAISCDVGNLSRLERGTQAASLELAEKLVKFYGENITEMQILYPKRYMQPNIPSNDFKN
ncbi:helix-turn-helix domain-containing protein [Providencia manganoxydans]|uniref:helix-turn-helix domain-containing protein n=1 Tax=Providencia manganoxydans TaxID=2923283 RepID=UPI0032DB655B